MERQTHGDQLPTIHDLLAASLTGPLRGNHQIGGVPVSEILPGATDETLYLACNHVQDAHHAGRQWACRQAADHLNAAYAALGRENPAGGADWHAGRHPIQQSVHHPYNLGAGGAA